MSTRHSRPISVCVTEPFVLRAESAKELFGVGIFSCNRSGVLRVADRHRPSSSAGIQPAAATART